MARLKIKIDTTEIGAAIEKMEKLIELKKESLALDETHGQDLGEFVVGELMESTPFWETKEYKDLKNKIDSIERMFSSVLQEGVTKCKSA